MKRQIIACLAAAPLALGLGIAGAPAAHAAALNVTATSDGKQATITISGCDSSAQGNDKAITLTETYQDPNGLYSQVPSPATPGVTVRSSPLLSNGVVGTYTFTCTYYGGGQLSKSVDIGNGYVEGVATLNQEPVAGAVVTLFDAKGNQVGSTTSGRNGHIDVGPVADGDYYAKVVFPNGDVKYYKISVAAAIGNDWIQVDSIPASANPTPAPAPGPANPGHSSAPGLSNTGGSDSK